MLGRTEGEVNFIENNTENLAVDIIEKTEMAGKIFTDHLFNSQK